MFYPNTTITSVHFHVPGCPGKYCTTELLLDLCSYTTCRHITDELVILFKVCDVYYYNAIIANVHFHVPG